MMGLDSPELDVKLTFYGPGETKRLNIWTERQQFTPPNCNC